MNLFAYKDIMLLHLKDFSVDLKLFSRSALLAKENWRKMTEQKVIIPAKNLQQRRPYLVKSMSLYSTVEAKDKKKKRLYCKKVLNICIIFYKGLSNLFWGQYNEVHVDLYIDDW